MSPRADSVACADIEAECRWEAAGLEASELDAFLLWAAARGASDVALQTGRPPFVEIDGRLRRVATPPLGRVQMEAIARRLAGETAEGILRAGRAIDCSHAAARGRDDKVRFRCNLAAVQVEGGFAVDITLRILPSEVPSLEALAIEPEIAAAWDAPRGLVLVTGVPGSGKSTLLAAGTRRLLEGGQGRIQSYEAPIEFVFDAIEAEGALMSASEIPRHFATFAEGLRASLRRRPAAVIVGEARDRETVDAAVRAADTGIAVYTTAHTVGVAATVRRLLAEVPAAERAERGAALIDVLHVVVTQVLVPHPRGGRTALREWLTFTAALKAELLALAPERWAGRIAAELDATGNGLAAAAGRAHAEGSIDDIAWRRLRVASRPGERHEEPAET